MLNFLAPIFCLFLLFFIHFGFSGSFERTLINYDDLLFIDPISKLSLKRYFTFWVKNPYGNAHPLRDLSWMLDAWIQKSSGLPSYWLTQWLLFIVFVYLVWQLFSLYLSKNKTLAFCLLLLFCTHPTLVEIIQWASARRNLMPLLFLMPASTYLLRSEKENRSLSYTEWSLLGLVWFLSLLCYPVGIFWPVWAYWLKRNEIKKQRYGQIVFSGIFILAFFLNSIWKVQTDLGWKQAVLSWIEPDHLGISFYYGWRSIGRGIWNLVFPYWLSVYYSELSFLNGLGLFIGGLLWGLAFFLSKKVLTRFERQEVKSLFFLGFTLFIPQSIIFLSYGDFVWADRYTLCILPFVFLLIGIFLQKIKLSEDFQYLLFFLFVISFSAQTIYSHQKAPLWLSLNDLLTDCSKKEKAPSCFIRAIDMDFESLGCSPKKNLLAESKEIWLHQSLPYSYQFKKELPFFESLCVALNARNSPESKIAEFETLKNDYQDRGELIPGLILVYLQNQNFSEAYQAALKYPLRENPLEINTTRAVVTFMRGQMKALCSRLKEEQNSFAEECENRRMHLEDSARADYYDEAIGQWANQLTLLLSRPRS